MKRMKVTKQNLLFFLPILITAVAVTVAAIVCKQKFLRFFPLYNSLIVGALQAKASRYCYLIGGFNALLYIITYASLGLYGNIAGCVFSSLLQLTTFFMWNRRKYEHSTTFKKLSPQGRWITLFLLIASSALTLFVLDKLNSSYQILDTLTTIFSTALGILTLLCLIEHTWLFFPYGILNILLNYATLASHPEQMTHFIFSLYSFYCMIPGFFSVRKIYREQQALKKEPPALAGNEKSA